MSCGLLGDFIDRFADVHLVPVQVHRLLAVRLDELSGPIEILVFHVDEVRVDDPGRVPLERLVGGVEDERLDARLAQHGRDDVRLGRAGGIGDGHEILRRSHAGSVPSLHVRAEADGVPGAILGQTWVPAGVNRGVLVTIDPGQVTETLYVTLHMDGGELELFEYPDGPDLPLQRNRTPVRAPFRVLAVPAG